MPLIYFALESDVAALQEKALRVIPKLCETLDVSAHAHSKLILHNRDRLADHNLAIENVCSTRMSNRSCSPRLQLSESTSFCVTST